MSGNTARKADLNGETATTKGSIQTSITRAFAKAQSIAVSDQDPEGVFNTQDTRQERAVKWTDRVDKLRSKLYGTKNLLEESNERLNLLQQLFDECDQTLHSQKVGRTGPTPMARQGGEEEEEEEGE